MIYIIPKYFENGIKFEKELDQYGIVIPISVYEKEKTFTNKTLYSKFSNICTTYIHFLYDSFSIEKQLQYHVTEYSICYISNQQKKKNLLVFGEKFSFIISEKVQELLRFQLFRDSVPKFNIININNIDNIVEKDLYLEYILYIIDSYTSTVKNYNSFLTIKRILYLLEEYGIISYYYYGGEGSITRVRSLYDIFGSYLEHEQQHTLTFLNNNISQLDKLLPIVDNFGNVVVNDIDMVVNTTEIYNDNFYKKLISYFHRIKVDLNFIKIENGIVSWTYKGTVDEVHNMLNLPTKVDRDIGLKVLRTLRGIISHTSRTEYRKYCKETLKSNNINDKIEFLDKVYDVDIFSKNEKIHETDFKKFITFQLCQTIALIEGTEIFTKKECKEMFINSDIFLNRVSGTYPYYIIHLMKRFLKQLKEKCRQVDENTVELFGKHYNDISKV